MAKFAIIKTGGKQYLVKENDEIVVEKLTNKPTEKLALETLAVFESEKSALQLGTPTLKQKVTAELLETAKGEKLRVARFHAKVRYRKVKGFRPTLSKIKILKIQ